MGLALRFYAWTLKTSNKSLIHIYKGERGGAFFNWKCRYFARSLPASSIQFFDRCLHPLMWWRLLIVVLTNRTGNHRRVLRFQQATAKQASKHKLRQILSICGSFVLLQKLRPIPIFLDISHWFYCVSICSSF